MEVVTARASSVSRPCRPYVPVPTTAPLALPVTGGVPRVLRDTPLGVGTTASRAVPPCSSAAAELVGAYEGDASVTAVMRLLLRVTLLVDVVAALQPTAIMAAEVGGRRSGSRVAYRATARVSALPAPSPRAVGVVTVVTRLRSVVVSRVVGGAVVLRTSLAARRLAVVPRQLAVLSLTAA